MPNLNSNSAGIGPDPFLYWTSTTSHPFSFDASCKFLWPFVGELSCVVLFSASGKEYARQGRVGAQWSRRHSKETLTEQQTEAEPEWPASQEACWGGSHATC